MQITDHPKSTKAKVEREVGTSEEAKKLHSPWRSWSQLQCDIYLRFLQDLAVHLNANEQRWHIPGIKVLEQAAALEISDHCWIFSIHVLKSSGILLNVREQTTALTMLCYEFLGNVPLFKDSTSAVLCFKMIFIQLIW